HFSLSAALNAMNLISTTSFLSAALNEFSGLYRPLISRTSLFHNYCVPFLKPLRNLYVILGFHTRFYFCPASERIFIQRIHVGFLTGAHYSFRRDIQNVFLLFQHFLHY